jgi:hypothetical protein
MPIARSEADMNMSDLVAELGDYGSGVAGRLGRDPVSRPGADGQPYYELLGEHSFG